MIKNFVFLLLLTFSLKTFAQGPCLSGDCENGLGKYLTSGGDLYEGHFKDGLFEGRGMVKLKSGDLIEGDWKRGIPYNGNITFVNGDKYVGQINNFNPHGKGKLLFANGNIYVGDFVNGKMIGKGFLSFKDGRKYIIPNVLISISVIHNSLPMHISILPIASINISVIECKRAFTLISISKPSATIDAIL